MTDMVKVRSVEIPSLPSIEHSSINMFERDGNIYNGLSYNNREIRLVLLIHPDDPEDYDLYVSDIKRAFYTKEEAKLFCGDKTMYIWCVPEGDIIIRELGSYCAEMEITLIAYDPYWHGTNARMVNNSIANAKSGWTNSNRFTVSNKCDIPVYPILSIGFTQDTTFCQIENQTTGEKIFIGGIPEKESTKTPKYTHIKPFPDNMSSSSNWIPHSSPIDSGRGVGGKITTTKDKSGLMAEDYSGGGSNTTWSGACAKRQLNTPVKDFMVRVKMNHNSTGENGDPSHPFDNDYTSGNSGTTTYYYEVTASTGLILRAGKSTSSAKICTMPKGTKLYPTEITNGWAKVTTHDGKTGYCYTQYLAKKVSTTTNSGGQCNYATVKATAIRASASKTATNKKTIPKGECIRVYNTKYPETADDRTGEYEMFYKLAKPYDGVTGYVLINNLREGSDYRVDYDYEVDLADHKTGICEVYGYGTNSTQLFRMGMYDDNEYYEFTYPMIRKNSEDFLVDKTTAPSPKKRDSSKVASGKYGDWNEFYGELYIERINNVWYSYVQKIENGQVVKEIKSKAITDTNNSEESLDYLVIYFGTSGNKEDASCMSITDIEVKTGSDITEEVSYNFQEIEPGDILEIDNSIPEVRLNGKECNQLINTGSSFFALMPGDNVIKVASDDAPNVDIIWNDKNL